MRIMVCYSGSDESREVLREAIKHAKAFNAEIMLVRSVLNDHRYFPDMMDSVERDLKEAQSFFDENNVTCSTYISYHGAGMDPGEDLVMFASREQVDEMFIGIRARSRVGKFLLGSVAQWVILKAECPVVGVKHKMN